ncbi:hypothetical protein JCM10550A_06610 [Methanogenium cariaci]|jgi:hypothetical protein
MGGIPLCREKEEGEADEAPFRDLLFWKMYDGVSYISRRKESRRRIVEDEGGKRGEKKRAKETSRCLFVITGRMNGKA